MTRTERTHLDGETAKKPTHLQKNWLADGSYSSVEAIDTCKPLN